MLVTYTIEGSCSVPDGAQALEGLANQFRLPTGEIFSVHPVIEIASGPDADDHRDLTYQEAAGLGIRLEFYERSCDLLADADGGDPELSPGSDEV